MRWGKALIGLAAAAGLAIPLCCCEARAALPAKQAAEQQGCCSKDKAPEQHKDCPCSGQTFRDTFAKTDTPRVIADTGHDLKTFSLPLLWTSIQTWRPAAVPLAGSVFDPDLPARGAPRYLLFAIFRC